MTDPVDGSEAEHRAAPFLVCADRVQAVVLAYETDLVRPGD